MAKGKTQELQEKYNLGKEIKFKAKTFDGDTADGWVCSTVHGLSDFFYGIEDGRYDEDTLCQFVGMKDKNGTEIYEGDIVRWRSRPDKEYTYEVIELKEEDFSHDCMGIIGYDTFHEGYSEVVGNVYDNPELLNKLRK